MKIIVNDTHLILEGEEDGERTLYETILSDAERDQIKIDQEWLNELTKMEREWKVSFPTLDKKGYIRIGKLQQNNVSNLPKQNKL